MISFENTAFSYADNAILSDITLSLEPGAFYFLTGPSGAGKTTFLRLCTLTNLPQSGRMTCFGEDAAGLDRDGLARARRRMGIVHQDCRFLDHLTLRQNIALPLEVAGRDAAAHEADIADLLGWVELAARADALPPELSGGERQRAALARAVMLSPEIVFADEPTGNIDRDMARKVLSLLVELNRLGRTVLVATHDIELIRMVKSDVAARVLRLVRGEIRQAGSEL